MVYESMSLKAPGPWYQALGAYRLLNDEKLLAGSCFFFSACVKRACLTQPHDTTWTSIMKVCSLISLVAIVCSFRS